MVIRKVWLAALLCCVMTSVAKADYIYSLAFTPNGSAAGPFSGVSGGLLSIPVYLVETGTQGGGSPGLANGLGLTASNFDFNSGTSTLTSFTNTLSVLPAAVSGANPYSVSASGFPPGVPGAPFPGGNSVQVGFLNLTLGPEGASTISLAASTNPVAPNTYTIFNPAGASINGIASSFASSTLNVSAVPEPSSMALTSLALCGLALRRRKSRLQVN